MKISACVKTALVPLSFLLLGGAVLAQPAFRVKDINTTRLDAGQGETYPSGYRTNFAALGETVFFPASDGLHRSELWRTDGTDAGTRLVADLCPGSCASTPQSITAVGGLTFFLANDGSHGRQLWKSDGTPAGTALVKPLLSGSDYPYPEIDHLTDFNGLLVFSLADYAQRRELWRSDGTADGTFPLADFRSGASSSSQVPEPVVRLGGKLFFGAKDSAHGLELWTTDGTAAGTTLLKDISPGPSGSALRYGRNSAVAAGNRVFFGATGPEGFGLWKSDGTEAGTVLVKVLGFTDLAALGGEVFFLAPDGGPGPALWKSDGTAGGTVPMKAIPANARALTTAGNRLFFFAGCGLWTSNGTQAGTVLVETLSGSAAECNEAFPLAVGGNELLFAANDGVYGREIWKSDGTAAGTSLLADLNPGAFSSWPMNGLFANGRWYFWAWSQDNVGAQAWTSDGTAAGTRVLPVARQASGLPIDGTGQLRGPRTFLDLNGTLLFPGDDGVHGPALWKTDGTAAGTFPLKNIFSSWWYPYYPGPLATSSYPGEFTRAAGTVFFRVEHQLWKTDGTPAGTRQVMEFFYSPDGGSPDGAPRDLTPFGDGILFLGTDNFSTPLVKSDGTPEGTEWVDQNGWDLPLTFSLIAVGDKVLFQGTENPADELDGLWRTDGTVGGTVLLGKMLSHQPPLTDCSAVRDGVLLFAGADNASGEELWRSDGTPAGTYRLAEIVPGPGSKPLGPFALAGSTVFFAAGHNELWKTDGAEIHRVRALPGDAFAGIRDLTPFGEKVYFSHDDGVHGRELWVSDGTEAGTRMVEDLQPGLGSSNPRELHVEGSLLVFSASDGVHGQEPWRSDGTPLGTRMLQDIAPGALPSSPAEFTASGSNLYFAANDGATGFELWAFPRQSLLATFADVPADHWAWSYVETLVTSGITGGCGLDTFCPAQAVTRAEAAVFLVRAAHGPDFLPSPATGAVFQDVPAGYWAGRWIEQLAADGVTSGCGGGNFCPSAPLTRAEMAVLLLRSRYGNNFFPPPATGAVFNDVPADHWAAPWIERLAAEGVTGGCGNGAYCPSRTTTRAEMAVFLTRMFGLPLSQ